MNPVFIIARDLPDAWFQCVYELLDKGRKYKIDHGSYKGQYRLEFDYITIHIKHPASRPLLPDIPPQLGIPNPVSEEYLNDYLPYVMTDIKQPNEDYTYGSRLSKQIEAVINMYKTKGFGTNQAAMSISQPNDIFLNDPPCWRHCDTRILNNKLHFFVYYRCLPGSTHIIAKVDNKIISTTIDQLYDYYINNKEIEVVSVDRDFNPIWGKVSSINRTIKNNIIEIDLFGADVLELTEDHKVIIYDNGKYIEKKACELNIGDKLVECKDLSNLRTYTSDYIDLFELFKYNSNIYITNLTLDDFKKLREEYNIYSRIYVDHRHVPISKVYNTFLSSRDNLILKCQKQKNINRLFKISPEMAYFMGLWIADGWYNNNGNGLRLVIESTNDLKLNRILRFLKKEFNYIPSIEKREDCNILNIDILFLAELFKNLGFIHGSKIKIIPQFIFNLPPNLLEEVFIGWYSGDSGVSTSSKLINNFSILLKFLNEKFSIYSEKPKTVFFGKENRLISTHNKYYRILPLNYKNNKIDINNNLLFRKIKKIGCISKEKIVYDISVNTDSHLFFCGTSGGILVHNSWDLWGGFPANLAATQLLKEYMASEIGVEDGEIIAASKGLHLYDYTWELAKLRTLKK